MTKKIFYELCKKVTFVNTITKVNVIYFDWKTRYGYKYAIASESVGFKELIKFMYDWAVLGIDPTNENIMIQFAETDEERFKDPLHFSYECYKKTV